jgi:hypothetical protein
LKVSLFALGSLLFLYCPGRVLRQALTLDGEKQRLESQQSCFLRKLRAGQAVTLPSRAALLVLVRQERLAVR